MINTALRALARSLPGRDAIVLPWLGLMGALIGLRYGAAPLLTDAKFVLGGGIAVLIYNVAQPWLAARFSERADHTPEDAR